MDKTEKRMINNKRIKNNNYNYLNHINVMSMIKDL